MDSKMNKLEALKAAHAMQLKEEMGVHKCDIYSLYDNGLGLTCYYVSSTSGKNATFAYEEPKPLARDTYIFATKLRLYLYAMGEIDDNGFNKCYMPGCCSKNDDGTKSFMSVKEFEIVETPTEFETMQTPDDVCVHHDCQQYINKYFRGGMPEHCQRCQISTSKPTGLKNE